MAYGRRGKGLSNNGHNKGQDVPMRGKAALEEGQGKVEFWTADSELVAALGYLKPEYIRTLGKMPNC
jgi:hypothetical protein